MTSALRITRNTPRIAPPMRLFAALATRGQPHRRGQAAGRAAAVRRRRRDRSARDHENGQHQGRRGRPDRRRQARVRERLRLRRSRGFDTGDARYGLHRRLAVEADRRLDDAAFGKDGKIDLDRPVADLVTPWPLAASTFDHRKITTRRLLSHTAGTTLGGYQGWTDFKELPTLEESLAGKTNGRGAVELFAPVGAKFQYSGGGYTLMQLAIERTTKRKYADLARELVFRPLAMTHSSVAMTPQIVAGAAQGHGDDGSPVPMRYYVEQAPSTLTTTVNDLAKWMAAGMNGGGVLSKEQLVDMYTPAPLDTERAAGEAVYGLGHFIERLADGSVAVGHDGRNQAGFRAKFLMRPQSRDGIVFLSNSRSGLALDRIVCLWGADAAKADPATVCKPQ